MISTRRPESGSAFATTPRLAWISLLFTRSPLIVVTHHSPSFCSVPARFTRDPLSAAYSSHLDGLVERSGAALWVHGHTHDSFDYKIGGTRVICNPRGYFGRELNRNFNPQFVIEIGGSPATGDTR